VKRCLLNESVATLMRRKPVIVSPREPIGRVLQAMVDENSGYAIVCEDGKLVGIFRRAGCAIAVERRRGRLRQSANL